MKSSVIVCFVKDNSNLLLENNIQTPGTPGGTISNSTGAPFSDKLMMFCNYLLCGLSLGAEGFGAGFSLRNDLIFKNVMHGKNVIQYQREGVQIMVDNGWLEEPPKMDL